MDYDTWLMNQIDEYFRECEPTLDRDGDVLNCNECDNEGCLYYADYHEDNDPASDFALQAEMDEALLWGI